MQNLFLDAETFLYLTLVSGALASQRDVLDEVAALRAATRSE